jgi:phospholipase/lecithinase/hemolysin
MKDDSGDRRGARGRSRPRRACLLAATAAAIALVAAACGGSPAAAPSTSPDRAQQMDAFALCVRDHGVPGFYISHIKDTSAADYNGPGLYLGNGWVSTPISPSPVVQAALKHCNHLLGLHGKPLTATSAQLRSAVKAAACMHTHGFADFPDPTEQSGQIVEPPLPTSINTSSPQFQSALKACNASP